MRLSNKLAAALAVATLFAPAAIRAQDDQSTFRADTRLVVLHASVVDGKGNLVTSLKKDDFKVFENSVEQQVKVFRREDVPVSMGLVIDNSGSMRDKRKKVEAAALALVKASNPQDEVLIVNFNDEAYEDVPFTNDVKKMEEGLTKIDSRGGTAMRDALDLVIDHIKAKAKKDKKVIFIVTDGNDNTSSVSLEKLVQKGHSAENNIVLYAIGLLSEEEHREAKKAKRALDSLTTASGGVAYYPKELAEVESLALQVAKDIRNQYIIAYSPTNQTLDGSFRTIRVQTSHKYSVRTRTGYYATPDTPKRAAVQQPER